MRPQELASGARWRDFADYFTLPGLWGGLDRLLAHALGLRLLPAGRAPPGATGSGRGGSSGSGGLEGADFDGGAAGDAGQAWADGVWHLRLWDSTADAAAAGGGSGGSSGSNSGGGASSAWRLLGDVFVEVCPPGGFPFTSLLRPTLRPGAWLGEDGGGGGRGGADVPGAVVIRLPLALSGGGASGASTTSDGEPAPPERPPALRGPFGLRALLHEAGHAAALLAAGAAAPHPLLAAAGAAGGGGGAVDLRELPAHAFEAFARDPAALALLSGHWRLGTPLPPRDAAALARYAFSAGACSALDLREAALLAAADARLHALPAAALVAPDAAERVFRSVWDDGLGGNGNGLPRAGATLEALRSLEAAGAVGGAKWGYAAARLLAAAACKRWLGDSVLDPAAAIGGAQLKARLLYGLGAAAPPQALLADLLGADALERLEVSDTDGGGGGDDGDSGGKRRPIVCWAPDLYAAAFQDVDLLG